MLQKNEDFIGIVDGLGSKGEGVIHADGITFFVYGALYGEKVRCKVLTVKKNIGYAKLLEVLVPMDERVRPVCPAFGKCGGCQLQHMRYMSQLHFKSRQVASTLEKIGGIRYNVPLAVKSENQYGYRNKLEIPIGKDARGNNAVGFYAERSHRIVPISECPIHPAWSKEIISAIYDFMDKCGIDGYDDETKTGTFRHVAVREVSGNLLITVVVTDERIPGIGYLVKLLKDRFPSFSLYLNVNDADTNVVFGKKWIRIEGSGAYECREGGIVYPVSPQTFMQVNGSVRKKLYDFVVRSVGERECTVIDCYSGGGLLTAMLAQRFGKAYGIEIVPEATQCADALKQRNGLDGKMTNICGKVEDVLPDLLKDLPGEKTIVLDPPRKGVDRSVIQAVLASGVERVIMVSCNPATCARDIGLLCGSLQEVNGELVKSENPGVYQIESVTPFDMFPQTKWVETVVILSRQ